MIKIVRGVSLPPATRTVLSHRPTMTYLLQLTELTNHLLSSVLLVVRQHCRMNSDRIVAA
jgi:hypothetical protein